VARVVVKGLVRLWMLKKQSRKIYWKYCAMYVSI